MHCETTHWVPAHVNELALSEGQRAHVPPHAMKPSPQAS
jgi:hypothetical protein